MDVKEKLVELIAQKVCDTWSESCDEWLPHDCGKCYANDCLISEIADHLIANGVTVQERNDPITMDELRKMDGEPVWVSVSKNWRESGVSEGWCIVRFHSDDDKVRVYIYDTRHGARFFAQQDYGISWLAYRQTPKGETNDA